MKIRLVEKIYKNSQNIRKWHFNVNSNNAVYDWDPFKQETKIILQ